MQTKNFGELFEEYLLLRVGVSKNTLKFYKSDLNHFINWFLLRIKILGFFAQDIESAVPYLNINEAVSYKTYLEDNRTPTKTINRRLSALRRFATFLMEQNLLSLNFMDGVTNSGIKKVAKNTTKDDLASDFNKYLQTQEISHTTIKNYLSDIKHFMTWLENQKL